MGAVTRIRKTAEARMTAALTTLAEFAAEGRLSGLVFIARIDADETVGMFGDYSAPDRLSGLASRIARCADATEPTRIGVNAVIPLRAAPVRQRTKTTEEKR